jgi:serine phosphatase RsbU (regulator of sigma subunit)
MSIKYSKFIWFTLVCCLLICLPGKADIVHGLSISGDDLNFSKEWKFHNGDNKEWANPSFDDRTWDTVSLEAWSHKDNDKLKGICWFRQRLKVPPALFHKMLLLLVEQSGASEVYLDNKLVKSFGTVGDVQTEVPYDPENGINYIQLDDDSVQVVAVRFSANKTMKRGFSAVSFIINLADISDADSVVDVNETGIIFGIIAFAVFFTISIFHLLLFLYYRKVLSNLYYSVLALLISAFWLYPFLIKTSHNPLTHALVNQGSSYLYAPCFFLIILLLYSVFEHKKDWQLWCVMGLTFISEITLSINRLYFLTAILSLSIWASIRGIAIVVRAVRAKKAGAWIIASGFFVFLGLIVCVLLYLSISFFFFHYASFDSDGNILQVVLYVWAFSIPISMSVYLASDSARTNKRLALQLIHVKQLSEQNIEKEREKQQIIERQKETLEIKVKEATAVVSKQKDLLAEKNKEITDSINYARRIQTSILPEEELFVGALGEYMVLYKPKDVVSGDFYWCHPTGDKVIFAIADCTGHGVPGAFMSMIGNSLLNEIVIGGQITEANSILDALRSKIVETLQQNAQHLTTRDGMDIALCVLDKKTNILQFAGANNSLYLVSKNIATNGSVKETARVKLSNEHLLEILPDKQPIGYQEDKMNDPFTKNIIQLHSGDTVFITSDGYTDQFGGDRNKKFTSKRFRELIASLVDLPLAEQQRILDYTIEDWKKDESQTDDICLMGIRIS